MSNGELAPRKWVQPEWWGPLQGWIGGVIPFSPLLGRSEAGAVVARNVTVYPNGIAFHLHALMRPELKQKRRLSQPEPPSPAGSSAFTIEFVDVEDDESLREDEPLPTDRVRYAVEFDDGRRAERTSPVGGPGDFTILAFQEGKPVAPDPAANIVLNGGGGNGGSEFLWEKRFIWPLPPGALTFVCEWEDASIDEQRITLDKLTLQQALGRAHAAWPQ